MCFPLEAIAVHFNGSQRSAQGWANCPTIRARFIGPGNCQARGAAFISFSLQRGRGAPFGATSWSGTFERCRVPYDRHARLPALHLWRFLTRPPDFFAGPKGLKPLTLSRQHSRRPSSDESQPLKAAPSSGAAGDLAPWDGGTNPACRRHTRLHLLSVPRRRPQLSKAWPVYRVGKGRKDCCDSECEFTGDRD